MTRMTYLSPSEFRIFAHRGTSELGATENTIEAFRDALKNGCKYIETDVQCTKDGIVVAFHDSNLKRLCGVNRKVSQVSYADLVDLAKTANFEVSKFEDILAALPSAKFNVDFKSMSAVNPGVAAIIKQSAIDRVLVSSFDRRRRKSALRLLPDVATSADSTTFLLFALATFLGLKRLVKRLLSKVDALQIPTSYGPIRLTGKKLLKAAHENGVEVHYWVVNDVQTARELAGKGADGIVTDRCKLMTSELVDL